MAIFELTGVPCSGKSFFIKGLQKKYFKSSNVVFFDDSLILYHYRLFFLKGLFAQLLAEIILLFSLFTYNRTYLSTIVEVFIISKRVKLGFFKRFNLYRNITLKFCRLGFVKRKFFDKDVVFDEGISHIPFNLIPENLGETIASDLIYDTFASTLSIVNVIALDSSEIDLFTRLKNRGHKRILGRTDEFIKQFLHRNKAVYQSSISCLDEYCYQVNLINPNHEWNFN